MTKPLSDPTWAQRTANIIKFRSDAVAEACIENRTFYNFEKVIARNRAGYELPFSEYNEMMAAAFEWCFERRRHLGHMGPPGISKSTALRLFLCYRLGIDPTISTCIISAEFKGARRQVGMCRGLILGKKYQSFFPDVKPDMHRGEFKKDLAGDDNQGWTKSEFYLRNAVQAVDPAMSADAAEPKTEARRLDICWADDVMSRVTSRSTEMRNNLCDAINLTWEQRVSEGGMMMITHNCWMSDDLLHRKLNDSSYISIWVGVPWECDRLFVWIKNAPKDFPLLEYPKKYSMTREYDKPDFMDHAFSIPLPTGRPKWTQAALIEKRDSKPDEFRQLFSLVAVNPSDLMFSHWKEREQFDGTVAQMLRVDEFGGKIIFDNVANMRFAVAVGIDIGSGKREGDSISAWAKNHEHQIFPLEHHRGVFDDDRTIDLLDDLWERGIHFRVVKVENNGIQERVVRSIQKRARQKNCPWSHTVQGIQTGSSKMSPDHGLPAINTMYLTKQIIWPARESKRTDVAHAKVWARRENEIETCPRFLEPGKTPDSIMSDLFAITGLDEITVGKRVFVPMTSARPDRQRIM